MRYSHEDGQLVKQPVGYWTWAANKTLMAYVRGRLAAIGITQPQWWVLHQVLLSGGGATRDEVVAAQRDNLDVGAGLVQDIDLLVERGLLVEEVGVEEEGGRLRITDEGRELHGRAARTQQESREKVHAGISDEEYLATLKVLQRMMHNAGADVRRL
ncbi:winged helix-turn-helix transcriptional regulator [Streptomyces durbertensis]|uniref:Winged helix-turn-helix transcriptional regulator n=1 Tax=Streptomyces durbertensis TaxID=2448886 RepID=A0ABR6EAG4_9ACTN|nr:MarR family winged helix-turn-helix transcriptional regulator [Streptomyces durbertensis]MBB1242316.1 winged helix-turn-helix transcriptional regulator [Streptomyces durbertensis]